MFPTKIQNILNKKNAGQKIVTLTAYDYPLAVIVDNGGVDIILVGDSLANVVLGLPSTRDVGMAEMIHHTKAVTRAVKNALVVGDMPYSAYQIKPADAVKNAKSFVKAGCGAVKIEWFDKCLSVTKKIVKAGIPVMGHVGLTPQTAEKLGGFKVQGKEAQAAGKILQQAVALEKQGCFSIVLECIPDKLAEIITQSLKIPTIGIGAGPLCDGQVLVTHDMLGLVSRFHPRFAKQYVNLGERIADGVRAFSDDVKSGRFPDAAHSFSMAPEEWEKMKKGLKG